jgi:hypothetical protein
MKTRWIGLAALLAVSVYGCSADSDSWIAKDKGTADAPSANAPATGTAVSAVTVKGQSAIDGANTVEVTKMGDTTPVATGKVNPDGSFQVDVPQSTDGQNQGAVGLYVMSLKNIVGAVVGSAVLNGIPAFAKGFLVQAPLDAVTSFKTEVLATIQKKGVPGVQNYLNVVDAYVDANLAGVLATTGAFESDESNIIGAVSDSIIAAEKVIDVAFKAAGIPLDLGVLESTQATIVSGIQGALLDANGKFSTGAKNLVASLEAASAKAAAPIDQLLFNAVVGGGNSFANTFKSKSGTGDTADKANFAASKSVFNLQTNIATSKIRQSATGADADSIQKLEQACTDFLAAGSGATKPEDFDNARTAFSNTLMGKNQGAGAPALPPFLLKLASLATQVLTELGPLGTELQQVLTNGNFTPEALAGVLTKVDNAQLPAEFGDIFKLVQKDVVL